MKNRCLLAAVVALGVAAVASGAPRPLVFDSPAENDRGAMILGNGELGALAWVSADGTLHTVLQNSDSWNEGGRHVKTGAIDYATGRPVDEGTFRQELSLARGEFEASWRSGGKAVSLSVATGALHSGREKCFVLHGDGSVRRLCTGGMAPSSKKDLIVK
jgi:hypothetical protein